jgi:pimeloyl-ACP methyl ester carboxylesterase
MRQDLSEGAGATDYPPMVLLHGIFGKPADWDECERYFDGSCEVFAPRLPMADANLEHVVHQVMDFLDGSGIERARAAGGRRCAGNPRLMVSIRTRTA